VAKAAPRKEFLLEIGCEEIPAGWLPDLTEQLRARFEEASAREFLEPVRVEAVSTPRRLVVRADLRVQQADREEQVWGPSLKIARDASGAWTKAAEGFARKNDVALDALAQGVKDPAKPDEVNLLHVKRIAGRSAADVLSGVIASTLRALAFPKRMNWDAWLDDGKGVFPFGRPIRWLVTLFDRQVVPFTVFACVRAEQGPAIVTSGDRTYGHRFLPRGKSAGKPVRVRGFAALNKKLREIFVILDARERRAEIERQLGASPEVNSGDALERGAPAPRTPGPGVRGVTELIRDDHGLRDEWPQLVEFPTVVVGSVPEEFQSLPVEVLETVLVHHQKYIPLVEDGRVTRFAAVTNTDATASPDIVRGMQRVCVARFRDARFFYEEDRKRRLGERVDDLQGVTFHQKLGTYREKALRLVQLVDVLREDGALTQARHPLAQQAALLCKADLTTSLVREFTELQGQLGGVYLAAEGADAAVSRAVYWHYHPIGVRPSDPPPREQLADAAVFAAVSLVDKLDTLAGYFLVGLEPKGSSDPFGLRRAAQGAVRVLLDFWDGPRPGLRRLAKAAVEGYPPAIAGDRARACAALEAFLLARLESVLGARGTAADEVAATLAAPLADALDDPRDASERAQALHAVRAEAREDFEHLAVAFKRAHNILAGQPAGSGADPALFEHDAERELHAALARLEQADDASYEARLRALAGLRAPVDRFFDDVLVMAEDARVRANRLALLAGTVALFHRIADVSRLGG
jgi:glycyl-tRNA synthetase beta chain